VPVFLADPVGDQRPIYDTLTCHFWTPKAQATDQMAS